MIKVIFENEDIVAINKPNGLVVHEGVNTEETLTDWILENYPEMVGVGEDEARPGIVHRLDKDTSGVMLLAKNNEVFNELKKHFQKGKIKKEYHAFLYGKVRKERGSIVFPIGRSKTNFRKQTISNIRGEAREAYTEFVVEKYCGDVTFVKFYPKTGRMHQIRVHAKAMQTPVICDPLYAPKGEKLLGFERLALHSRSIEIQLHDQDPLRIEAEYPDDFKRAIEMC